MAYLVISGDEELELAVSSLMRSMSHPSLESMLGKRVLPYLQGRARARFQSEGDNASGPWAELAPATVLDREAQGFPGSHPINVRTGQLQEFVTSTFAIWSSGVSARLMMPAPSGGTLEKKFAAAQTGSAKTGKAWGKRNPARPVAGLSVGDAGVIVKTVHNHLESAFLRGRFGL